jgi:hypothetical protein
VKAELRFVSLVGLEGLVGLVPRYFGGFLEVKTEIEKTLFKCGHLRYREQMLAMFFD